MTKSFSIIFSQDGWVNKHVPGCAGLYLLQRMGMSLDDGFGQLGVLSVIGLSI